jgi:NAD(P)-dependent dehydrogenase (short-subunit alcohol dehydrogenase family)
MELKGRVAVITGAASGFGREFARTAVSRGMKVVLADIDTVGLEAVVAELRARGAAVLGVPTDVAHADAVQALADATMKEFGSVHLLFNNAGVAVGGFTWEATHADWQWVMGVNLWSVIHGVRIFTPLMLAHGEPAHIVNTASVAGLFSPPNMSVYNVTKHAVVTLSETLYSDLRIAHTKIGVSVLCPAFVPTGIAHSQRNRPADLQNDAGPTPSMLAAQAHAVKSVESGRMTAAEIADVTFAAIDDGRFYIIPHDEMLPLIQLRVADVVAQRPPTDPAALARAE